MEGWEDWLLDLFGVKLDFDKLQTCSSTPAFGQRVARSFVAFLWLWSQPMMGSDVKPGAGCVA
eukprot:856230-Amphidinium_carterae.1